MRNLKTFAILGALLMLLSAGLAEAASDKDVDILIVFPEKLAPSKVYMTTDGEMARGLLIPFAAIVNSVALNKRSEELGAQLDRALEGYDRYSTIFGALDKRFKVRSPMFVSTETRAASTYLSEKGITPAAGAEGYDFVIAIEDKFSGLSMLNALATKTDDLAPATALGYRVYDARKRERIAKGVVSGNGVEKRPFREAVNDRALFVGAYDGISTQLAVQLVGALFRTDKLHAMAESVGRGEEVPRLSAVLKRYEKRFGYTFRIAKDWKQTKMNMKYLSVLEPKSDLRFALGLKFEVDLLIPEFGQDVATLDEYVSTWQARLADEGIDLANFKEFPDIDAPEGYRVYSIDLPNGIKQISLVRILNDDMLEMISLVFTRDFDTLYPQNRRKMEQMIAAAKLEIR